MDDGKIKVVAVLGRERPSFLQQWPTMTDAGLNVDAGLNLGLYVPAGTPADDRVAARRRDAAHPEGRGACASASTSSAWRSTPISQAALAERIRSEAARYRQIIEQTGVKLN